MTAQSKPKGLPYVLELTVTRPGLAIGLAVFSFLAGFITTGWLNRADLIRAEGVGSQADERRIEGLGQSLPTDPDVWPVLDHSFPQQLDLLSPEPLIVPGRSLGPARVDHVTLAAALRSELEAPVRDADVTPARSETAALDLPDQPKQAASTGDSASQASTACLPEALRSVLIDLEARFGELTIVSTTHLHTDNHSAGSARARLHLACKAIDVRTSKEPKEAVAYLRSRPEVGGVSSYRNGVIHFDLKESVPPATRESNRVFRRGVVKPRISEQPASRAKLSAPERLSKPKSRSVRRVVGAPTQDATNQVPEQQRLFD